MTGFATQKKSITPEQAFNLITENKDNPDFVLIDIRTLEEHAGGHIAGSLHFDYYLDDFRDNLNNLDKNKQYLIYCGSGKRSGMALDIMAELGFNNVQDIEGGIGNWKEKGFEVLS